MILILSFPLFSDFIKGKNAELLDIKNNCSCELTSDRKVFDFQRHIQKQAENAFFKVQILNASILCICYLTSETKM